LKWAFPDGYANRATTGQTAEANGGLYALAPGENGWCASFTRNGKTQMLATDTSAAKCYAACVTHHRTAQA